MGQSRLRNICNTTGHDPSPILHHGHPICESSARPKMRCRSRPLISWRGLRTDATRLKRMEGVFGGTLNMSLITLPLNHAIYSEPELANHPGFYGWPDGTSIRTTL